MYNRMVFWYAICKSMKRPCKTWPYVRLRWLTPYVHIYPIHTYLFTYYLAWENASSQQPTKPQKTTKNGATDKHATLLMLFREDFENKNTCNRLLAAHAQPMHQEQDLLCLVVGVDPFAYPAWRRPCVKQSQQVEHRTRGNVI